MISKKNKKEEQRLIGRCGYCNEYIFEKDPFEILIYDRPSKFNQDYKEGPIHNKCRIPMFKRLTKDLINDLDSFNRVTDMLLVSEKKRREKAFLK